MANRTRRGNRPWQEAAAVVMVVAAVLPCAAESGDDPKNIDVNAGALSVHVGNVPLSKVLRMIGEEAGVRVNIHGNLGNAVPQAFSNVPLADGITLLVQHSNADLVLIFQRDAAGQRYLTEIRAYERSPAQKTARPPPPPRIPTPAPPPQPVQPQ